MRFEGDLFVCFHMNTQFLQHHLLKTYSFLIGIPRHLCQTWVGHICEGLFVDSLLFFRSVCLSLYQYKTGFINIAFFKNKLIDWFLAALGLRCCAWAFSSCSEQGLLFVVVHGLLLVVASLCCGTRALGTRASVVVACRLSSCGSQALERRLSSGGAWA